MEDNVVVDKCKEKLASMDPNHPLLVPKAIEDFNIANPGKILCNEITPRLATAILDKDSFVLMVLSSLGGLTNTPVYNFLINDLKTDDIILVHFYKDKSFYTCVVRVIYTHNFLIVHKKPKGSIKLCQSHGGIEFGSIFAIAKVPCYKKIQNFYAVDYNQSRFIKTAKRL